MIVEVWQDEVCITVAMEGCNKKELCFVGEAKLIRKIEGRDWDDCMYKHRQIMEPYKPFSFD